MTPEQQVAYIQTQAVCALIEALGMLSSNLQAQQAGKQPNWANSDFCDLINRYGIGHNDVIGYFTGG